MGRLVLILGGARSGKSSKAEQMALAAGGRVTFVATAEALDDEMKRRIKNHRDARPEGWCTVEEPLDVVQALQSAAPGSDVMVVDCMTLWVSNHLCRMGSPDSVDNWTESEIRLTAAFRGWVSGMVEIARSHAVTLLLVSNEVGMGLVPADPLGRTFRDLLGLVNRLIAAQADSVLLMVAGLAVDAKRLAMDLECRG